MIFKKTLLQISILVVFLTLSNLNYAKAQLEIKDSSNFTIVYKSLNESEINYSEYNFVGNYIVRKSEYPGMDKIFEEPILQIIDLTDWSFYNYYTKSKKTYKSNRSASMGSNPNQVLSQKDSTSEQGEFIYFYVEKDFTVDGKTDFYDVLFLKGFELPNKYKIIGEIYREKNTYFPTYYS